MDVNVQIGLIWTLLAALAGAAPAAVIAYVVGKRAGVREYHAARERKSAETRARKKARRNAPFVTETNPTGWSGVSQQANVAARSHAVPRGVNTDEGEE